VTHSQVRRVLTALWLFGAAAALYVYFFHREALEDLLSGAATTSLLAAGGVYLVLGCLRGFTLVPATSLVLLGIVFFEPWPLFLLTIVGILASSASVYYFAEALHLDEVLKRKHEKRMTQLHGLLERHGLPIVIAWSFFPLLPTDAVCYLAGVVRMRVSTMLLGVAIGEGGICAIYIFLGDSLLRAIGMR
jgi:uncharacterized membrane protein YdjX (TVP38/TMEM64 family)